MSKQILNAFPALKTTTFAVTSPQDTRYNCIAWALEDKGRWWWPGQPYYWPKGAPSTPDAAAFVAAFALEGYHECDSEQLEIGYQKVALYTNARGEPTHAARQMSSGLWSSKLGKLEDIIHTLKGLEGKQYGYVCRIFRRPVPNSAAANLQDPKP